jgi:SAM-dependent methyltransferase
MKSKRMKHKFISKTLRLVKQMRWSKRMSIWLYIQKGRKPWSTGYNEYKEQLIIKLINDNSQMKMFKEGLQLSNRHGEFIDERVVEYPWFISRLNEEKTRLLDAGSILNYSYILQHPKIKNKDITIITLEPENYCYYYNRVSYLFNDLRNIPIQNNWFDEIVCMSTLEHIGMDNSMYSGHPKFKEEKNLDYLKAVAELKRVTKPGGRVYITVPYGKYINFGWYQQFNAEMIDSIIDTFAPNKLTETYYCYESGGWLISDKQYCQKFEAFNIHDTKYFNSNSTKDYDPDYAAAARAIAALELWK